MTKRKPKTKRKMLMRGLSGQIFDTMAKEYIRAIFEKRPIRSFSVPELCDELEMAHTASLYQAARRLEQAGYIQAEENTRPVRYGIELGFYERVLKWMDRHDKN